MTNRYTMQQAREIICHCVENPLEHGQNRVVYLEGDPGIGKTALAHAIYRKYRRFEYDHYKQPVIWINDDGSASLTASRGGKRTDNIRDPKGFTHFVPYVAPEREPTDWGLPMPNADRTAIDMLPLSEFLYSENDRPFIFLDEIDKSNNMMQNVLGRVMHEQKVGSIVFPDGTFVLAAGNLMTNRAGSMTANTHIKNRRTYVPVGVDAKEWIEDVGIPFDLHSSVVSYIRTDPHILHKFDRDAPSFPSPRSWTKVGLFLNKKAPEIVERALIEGDVGVAASNTFWGHLAIFRSLRDPEQIIANPTKIDLPTGSNKTAVMYAEVTSLAKYADKRNADSIMQYFNRLPGEYGFVGYRDILMRDKSLMTASKIGQQWIVKNATLIQATGKDSK